MEDRQRASKATLAVNLGLIANIFLAAMKTGIGVIGHSPALLADGVNSTSDVAYYIVVAIFMRMARKPADAEHPFGHSQLESISALLVGSFVVTTAIAIFWDSVNTMYDRVTGAVISTGAASIALWVALLTIAIKLGLTVFTLQLCRQTQNLALGALAYDHRNDVFSASAAAFGIFLGRTGYAWVDPLAGALVALVILRTGIQILQESTSDLMDTIPGDALDAQVRNVIEQVEEVQQVEDIHAHRFGPYLVVNLTLCVDGGLTVAEGDCIASRVEELLRQQVDFLQVVHVHYHPCRY